MQAWLGSSRAQVLKRALRAFLDEVARLGSSRAQVLKRLPATSKQAIVGLLASPSIET